MHAAACSSAEAANSENPLKLFGVSVTGLRVGPALAAWATVVADGLTAREFTTDQLAMRHAYPKARPVFLGTDCPARGTA